MRFPFGRPRTTPLQAAAANLHDALIARIRLPVFYTDFGVADTFEGRFDLLVLHAGLVLRRLRDFGPDGQTLAQALVDTMFSRFDVAMRELGVSDIGVPKRMKRLAEAFKGRTAAYDAALESGDHRAFTAAIARNVLGDQGDAHALSAHALEIVSALDGASLASLRNGDLAFGALPADRRV